MPTERKAKATTSVRTPVTPGSSVAMSAMFNVPVIMYIIPTPIRMNVAPIVPRIRYWKAAVRARRLRPRLINA